MLPVHSCATWAANRSTGYEGRPQWQYLFTTSARLAMLSWPSDLSGDCVGNTTPRVRRVQYLISTDSKVRYICRYLLDVRPGKAPPLCAAKASKNEKTSEQVRDRQCVKSSRSTSLGEKKKVHAQTEFRWQRLSGSVPVLASVRVREEGFGWRSHQTSLHGDYEPQKKERRKVEKEGEKNTNRSCMGMKKHVVRR